MHNLLILGSGRSGTSMTAGLLRNSGYFFGDELHPGTLANQYGYFEDVKINYINSVLITRILFWRASLPLFGWAMPAAHRDFRASWLAAPRHIVRRSVPREIEAEIRGLVSRGPFCFKDPRFSVTLPFWRPYLPEDTRFLVVFRDPDRTVDSILRDASETYSPPLQVTPEWGYLQWMRNYARLLDDSSEENGWFFVDYSKIIDGSAIPAIEAFTQAKLDATEIDPSVSRARSDGGKAGSVSSSSRKCRVLYDRLRARAERDLRRYQP